LLTEKERKFLEYALKTKKTPYQIARHFSEDPGYVQRTIQSAIRKLREAEEELAEMKALGYPQNLQKQQMKGNEGIAVVVPT